MKKWIKMSMALVLALALSACAGSNTETTKNTGESAALQSATEEAASGEAKGSTVKHLNIASSFAYPSLDTHKEYYGWYTNIYGVSQTLFRIDENMQLQPLLAKEAKTEGQSTTIYLRDDVVFSNGNPLTADMVVRNLQRAAQVNSRFAYLGDFTMEALDEKSLRIDTPDVYPTLLNDLASPELGILDLDGTKDFDAAPIGTGPFVVGEFIPDSDVTVVKNANYWEGEVRLDSAKFIYLKDEDARLLAMQNKEVDVYVGANAAALEIFALEPDTYEIHSTASTRLNFYILNENTLDADVRRAVNMAVDKQALQSFLGSGMRPTEGPFSDTAAYGKAKAAAFDPAQAQKLLEEANYVKNAEGIYEKDGKALRLQIAYYHARGLDTIATLLHEQLLAVGIDSELKVYEDPDSTYIASGDFDIALYSMIADKLGDPYYFIHSTLKEGAYFDVGGFDSAEAEALIEKLRVEKDATKRAELANAIVQLAIDDNAFHYLLLFNKITVVRKGVSHYAEDLPFDFYALQADTDIQ